jgi:hypothetical protein
MLYRVPIKINTILSEYPGRNSGAAGAAIIRNFEDDRASILLKIDKTRLEQFYSDQDWTDATLVLKCPARTYSKNKPIIKVYPVIVDFDIGRSAWLASEKITNNVENSVSGVSNWEYRIDGIEWDAPGATGPLDIDQANEIEISIEEPYWEEVKIPLTNAVLSGLIGTDYYGLKISLESEITGDEIWFGTEYSRSANLAPYLEVSNTDQFLSRNSALELDNDNLVSIEHVSNGFNIMPNYKGQPYDSYDMRCTLVATLSLLYSKTNVVLDQSAATFDQSVPGRIFSTVNPSANINVDDEIVNIFSVIEGASRVGSDTFREGVISGSRNYTLEINAHWELEDGSDWVVINKTKIDVDFPTVVDTNLMYTDNFAYPRLTTVGMRRDFRSAEGPLKIRVFVDNRPPMEIANLQMRRRLNSRRSAVISDLAWGVSSGRQRHPGDWVLQPSDATLLDHDGSTHTFIFDPSILPPGLYKFEFVNLRNGNIIRQSNAIDFQIY